MDLIDEIAPGLRTLPDTLGVLRWPAPDDLGHLGDPGAIDALIPVATVGAGAYLLCCFAVRGVIQGRRERAEARRGKRGWRDEDEDYVERATNTPWLDRQWWKIHRPTDLMEVDGLVLKREGDGSHCLWLGPTGKGKSAAVATVRIDGRRPTLVITPDLSDPIIAKVRYGLPKRVRTLHWTAGGAVRVNFLLGPPDVVAERLTEVFRSGGNGVWKMTTRRVVTGIIEAIDATGDQRSLQLIGDLLLDAINDDRKLKEPCGGWADRFLSTALALGDSIAPGGADLAEILCAGGTVILDNDAMLHPGLRGDVVAFGLAEARRLANLVPGGFRLIFEEAGQLGERIDLADPFFQAGRRHKIACDAMSQDEDDMDVAISQNAATRVYYSQRRKTAQKAADDVLDIGYRNLDPSRMQRYTAWIATDNVRRLVRFPKPFEAPKNPGVEKKEAGNGNGNGVPEIEKVAIALPAPRTVITEVVPVEAEVELPFEQLPAWLGMDRAMLRMWTQGKRTRVEAVLWEPARGVWFDPKGCLEWQGLLKFNVNGAPPRPRANRDGKDVTPYRETYRGKFGVLPEPTFDHWCDNPLCLDPDHGGPCSIPDNNARRVFRARAFEAAGFELVALAGDERALGYKDSKATQKRWVRRSLVAA